jgi:hypothetical protein
MLRPCGCWYYTGTKLVLIWYSRKSMFITSFMVLRVILIRFSQYTGLNPF